MDRVASALREAADDLVLIANDPHAAAWLPGVPTFADVRQGAGSLGGVLTALRAADRPVLVVAWDMPFVSPALLRELRALGAGRAAAAAASDASGRLEPLCAYYAPPCAAAIEARIGRGDLRVHALLADVGAGILPLDRVRVYGHPDELFFNVNTRDDLLAAAAIAKRRG